MKLKSRKHKLRQRRGGFTLLELVVASTSAAVLMGGLASSLYIAGQSLGLSTGSLAKTHSSQRALSMLHADLQSALTFNELTATTVSMTVPDRNGDSVPETIRYAWSGVTGEPLTQQYNGGTPSTIAAEVQSFSLSWLTRLMEGSAIRTSVLFVTGQAPDGAGGLSTPTASEQLRIDLMSDWGYDATVISQQANQTDMDAQLAVVNVVYVSGEASGSMIGTKLNAATLGIVTESFINADELGFYSSGSNSSLSRTAIRITNTSHYITSLHATGPLTVVSSAQDMKQTSSSLAPDAVTLATVGNAPAYPTLLILDAGDQLASGAVAAGRRCQLPWGEGSFDVATLNAEGQTLMKRAIEWAVGAGDATP